MEKSRERFTCDWIFNILVVLCDGKVVCGCADPKGERPLGNLREKSLYDIWKSDKVKAIREGLNQGYSPFCLTCGLRKQVSSDEKIIQRPVSLEVLPRIFFEPTILCNISCFKSVCSKESGIIASRERKHFPFEAFKAVVDEVGEGLVRLDFFNYGESFVHPHAVDMIEYIKRKYPHVFLYISTNGLLLNKEKITKLVQTGVDEITFSVDGADPETYIKYRCGGDFSKIQENMKWAMQERNRVGHEVPFINWRYILFRWNDSKRKMNAARKLAGRIGVDRLTWEITDHPAEAKSEKYQIGTKAWKRIFYEIWDTSQISNAIKGKRYLASIKIPSKMVYASRGQPTWVKVYIKNKGGAKWLRHSFSGRRLVRLGAQLHDQHKKLLNLDYARAFLPHDIEAGRSAWINMELPSLSSAGAYWLKFDMVSEGIDWFESTGSHVVWKGFRVSD